MSTQLRVATSIRFFAIIVLVLKAVPTFATETNDHGSQTMFCPNLSGNFTGRQTKFQPLDDIDGGAGPSYALVYRCEIEVKPTGHFQIRASEIRMSVNNMRSPRQTVNGFNFQRSSNVEGRNQRSSIRRVDRFASGMFHFAEDCSTPTYERAVAYGYTTTIDKSIPSKELDTQFHAVDFRVWLSMLTPDDVVFRSDENGHLMETLLDGLWEDVNDDSIWTMTLRRDFD